MGKWGNELYQNDTSLGQIGGGTQYLLLDGRVDQLLADGILKIFGE